MWVCDLHIFGQILIWDYFKKQLSGGSEAVLSSSQDKHMVSDPSPKAICPLEPIIQSNLVQVLLLHYQAINCAEDTSDLHSSTTCAWDFCAAGGSPYMVQLGNT